MSLFGSRDSCKPTLLVLRSARGRGGLFIPGLIAVGLADTAEITSRIWSVAPRQVARFIREAAAEQGTYVPRPRPTDLHVAVIGRILAHEVGHAALDEGQLRPAFQNLEAAADYVAGQADAARGRNSDLGTLIFSAIGCTTARCSHPGPAGRAHAYSAGYEYELARRQDVAFFR